MTMYEAFYGLKERPFNLTPDPKYLYLSDKHKEAFAHLLFGIKHRSGFVMVTGEIGTGKTTICRNLLNQIDSDTNVAFVFNPPLNPVELIKKINVEFGISSAPDNALELTEILNKFLLEQATQSRNCVLVIDEAQNLSPQVLEQIRLLSNLETETDKLLQIVLIGQPELGEKLALHELRQLNQRITARYHLKALSEHETLQYLAYRLHVAGGRRKIQFSKSAVKAVYRYSGGTPRVINAICDRALLIGYTKEAVNISAAIVKQAAKEIRGEKVVVERPISTLLRQLLPSPSMALFAAVILVSVWYLGQQVGNATDQARRFNDVILPPQEPEAPKNAVEAKAEPSAPELSEEQRREEVRAEVAKALAGKIAPGVTVTAPEAAGAKALEDTLATLTPEAALTGAAEAMLGAWGVAAQPPALQESSTAGIAAYLTRHGLAAEELKPGLEQLLAIGRPAFLKVKHAQKELWVTLLREANGVATLAAGPGKTVEAPVLALKQAYLAEAVVPWKDPDPKAPAMSVGRGGAAVETLKTQLRELGRLDVSNKGDQYDQDTARAVSRIQAETGLSIDAVAGRQVRMIMSAWRPAPGTPLLSGKADAATATSAPEKPVPAPVKTEPAAAKTGAAAKQNEKKDNEPAMTPLPASLGKSPAPDEKPVVDGPAKPEPPKDGLVKVDALPKPEAPAPPAPEKAPAVDGAVKEVTPELPASAPLVPRE
jgi:general secretion pathway protein A